MKDIPRDWVNGLEVPTYARPTIALEITSPAARSRDAKSAGFSHYAG